MKKISFFILLSLFALMQFSCEKGLKVNMCHQVKYISEYCPNQSSSLVNFTAVNKDATEIKDANGQVIDYQAALLNVPDKYKVPGKIFYINYHYNDSIEEVSCPPSTIKIKLLTADNVSETDCNSTN